MLPCLRKRYLKPKLLFILCFLNIYLALKIIFDNDQQEINSDNQFVTNKKKESNSLSKLNIFDSSRCEIVQHTAIQAPKTCVQSGLEVIDKRAF